MTFALIGYSLRRPIYCYDIVFFALACAIVFPDKILIWISEVREKAVRWWHYVLAELLAVSSMVVATILFLPIYSKIKRWPLHWWEPLLWVGFFAATRIGVWLVVKLFDFDDWGD